LDNKDRIAHLSELSEVFTKKELEEWILSEKCEEKTFIEN
jgi:hypothetical protein